MFNKKKTPFMHYEGLPTLATNAPVFVTVTDDYVVFNDTIRLQISQIRNVELLTDKVFMGKYHNDSKKPFKSTVFFHVIHYVSSSGKEEYIALWQVGFVKNNPFELLQKMVNHSSGEIITTL